MSLVSFSHFFRSSGIFFLSTPEKAGECFLTSITTSRRPTRRTVVSDGRDDLQGDWTGLLSFVSAVLLSSFILLLLPSSSVSLSNFYLAVPMRGCLGKHLCISSPFPIAILNGTCSLRAPKLFCGDEPAIKTKQTNTTRTV